MRIHRLTFLALALLAAPVVALAQGAYSLAPFPTVAQLTAAIRAQTKGVERQDRHACKHAFGKCGTQRFDQQQMLDREEHYWHGDFHAVEAQLRIQEPTLKPDPSLPLTKETREMVETSVGDLKRDRDLLLADRELLREQQRLILP